MVDVWKELGKAIGSIFKPIFEIPAAIWKSLGDAAGDLMEGFVKGTKDLADTVEPIITPLLTGAIEEATEALLPGSPKKEVKEASEKLTKALMKALEESVPKKGESPPSLEILLASVAGIITTNVGLYLGTCGVTMGLDAPLLTKELGFRESAMDLINSFQLPSMIGPTLQAPIWSGVIAPLRMRMNQRFPYLVPDSRWITGLRAKGIISEETYTEAMSFQGLDESWASALAEGDQVIPAFGELREMLWRKTVNEPKLREALVKRGVRSDFLDGYIELTTPRVGSGDLITMSVREAFAERPGDEEMVERFVTEMAKWGYDRETCLWHWRSHWRLPALGEVFRMHHRGIVMPYTVEKFLQWADYSPEWRGPLEELSWDLPGRIDARWMYRWNIWGIEKLRDLNIHRGLDPKYAEDVALATARNQWLSEIRRLIDNAKRKFGKGYIIEETLRADLLSLDLHPDWVEYHIQDALADADTLRKDEDVDALGDGWIKDMITNADLEAGLSRVIVRPEALDAELNRLYIKKYKRPKPPQETEAETALKELRKYQVSYAVQAYRLYAVDKAELIAMLIEADVDPGVARARADYEELRLPIKKPSAEAVARAKEKIRIQKLEETKAITEFRKDLIVAEELLDRLQMVDYTEALATALTQLEIVRKYKPPEAPAPEKIPTLSVGTLRMAFREGVLSESALRAELAARGYTPGDVELIVVLEKERMEEAT